MKAQDNTYYIAFSIKVIDKDKKTVRARLNAVMKDSLKEVTKKGYIKETSVYSQNKTAEKHGEFPEWNYLIVTELESEKRASQVKQVFESIQFGFAVEKIRLEILITTPQSTYPIPQAKAKKRRMKPFYAIEYVDVKEDYLQEFKDIMIANNGPAMKYIMKHAKWCYNFYALETVQVYFHNNKYPMWNQIHVIGLYIDSLIHYKKDFSIGLKKASGISFEDNFARLKEIRTMRFKTLGRKII